jgi:hypothetical protein
MKWPHERNTLFIKKLSAHSLLRLVTIDKKYLNLNKGGGAQFMGREEEMGQSRNGEGVT